MKPTRRILVGVLVGAILGVGLTVAVARTPDPMGSVCDANASALPTIIPRFLIFNVTDEASHRVPVDIEPRVQREIERALSYYPFNASILVVTNNTTSATTLVSVNDSTHVAQVQLWLSHPLPSRWFEVTEGRMCGNLILVQEGSDEAYNSWSQKHELGHYFGLPHYDGTYMNGHGDRKPRHDVLNPCQQDILAQWVPGVPYEAHWARSAVGQCSYEESVWARYNPFGP